MLEICRAWGRDPGWFDTLPTEEQERLLGWWLVHTDPSGEATKPKGRGRRR